MSVIDASVPRDAVVGAAAGSGADAGAAARGARLRRAVARFPRGAGGGDRLRRVRLVALRLWRLGSRALPRPMRYMHDEALEVLPRVLDAAGCAACVLVGHSDGGSIAAIYAGTVHDPRVRGVVLIAAHFFVEDVNIASIRGIKATYDQGDLRDRLARYHRDVDVAFRGWNDAWLDPRFRAFDITEQVARIQVPVLALQGSGRPVWHRRSSCACWSAPRRARCETRLIAGARHAPHLEARQASPTLDAIVPFVPRNCMLMAERRHDRFPDRAEPLSSLAARVRRAGGDADHGRRSRRRPVRGLRAEAEFLRSRRRYRARRRGAAAALRASRGALRGAALRQGGRVLRRRQHPHARQGARTATR